MLAFIVRTAVAAVALWVAVSIVPGLAARDANTLLLAAIVLGIVNATVRPIAVLLSIPITIVTFGLFLLVVNAATIGLVAVFLGGFVVDGLWAGIGAAIITGVVSWVAGAFIGDGKRRE